MDAVRFLEEKKRLTNNCNMSCNDCRLVIFSEDGYMNCKENKVAPEELVRIIEKWSKTCPEKIYKTVVLKVFPKAEINNICVKHLFGEEVGDCLKELEDDENCDYCWNMAYKESK